MKKRLWAFLGLICCASLFAACTSSDPKESASNGSSVSVESGDSHEDSTTSEVHTHEYSVLKYDENNHWYECECGEKDEAVKHDGGEATCAELAKCEVCEQSYGELADHTYADVLTAGETTHWYAATCSHTGLKKDEADHTYNVLKYDENEHWYECVCGAKDEAVKHDGGEATCTELAKCEVCEQSYGELADHTYADVLTIGETTHWYAATCSHTDLKKDEADHKHGEYVVTEEAIGSAIGVKTATCECGDKKTQEYVNANVTGVFGTDAGVSATQGNAENQLDGSLKLYGGECVSASFTGANIPENATHIVIKVKAEQQLDNVSLSATGLSKQVVGSIGTEYTEIKLALEDEGCAFTSLNLWLQNGVVYVESITFEVSEDGNADSKLASGEFEVIDQWWKEVI